jgi:hypothetical protein
MSRPLMYDDQFTSLIHSNVRQKFLFCFQLKVQSTAFYRTCSLQNSIRICSVYDLFFALTILYCSFKSWSLIELVLIILSVFFCFVALNISNNFNKKYSNYYYFWRLAITILIPIIEFFDYSSNNICYYSSMCKNGMFYLGISIGLTIVHLYLCRISWSFSTRLKMGQELLIIHGKYLEQMLLNENHKNIGIAHKYSPPPIEMTHFDGGLGVTDKPAPKPNSQGYSKI